MAKSHQLNRIRTKQRQSVTKVTQLAFDSFVIICPFCHAVLCAEYKKEYLPKSVKCKNLNCDY